MTTIAFLMNGVREANPLVRVALKVAPTPISGLLTVKLAAVALGIYCWKCGRDRLLIRMNILFAVVVVWNLVAMILGSAVRTF